MEKKYETIELDIPLDTFAWVEEKANLCDLTPEQFIKALLVLRVPSSKGI